MIEVSTNEIQAIEEKETINKELQILTKYFIGLIIIAYTLLVLAIMAIIDVNNQQIIINNQSDTVAKLTAAHIVDQVILDELQSDNRLLDELRKVSKENR